MRPCLPTFATAPESTHLAIECASCGMSPLNTGLMPSVAVTWALTSAGHTRPGVGRLSRTSSASVDMCTATALTLPRMPFTVTGGPRATGTSPKENPGSLCSFVHPPHSVWSPICDRIACARVRVGWGTFPAIVMRWIFFCVLFCLPSRDAKSQSFLSLCFRNANRNAVSEIHTSRGLTTFPYLVWQT